MYLHLPGRHKVSIVPDPLKHLLYRFRNDSSICREKQLLTDEG